MHCLSGSLELARPVRDLVTIMMTESVQVVVHSKYALSLCV